MTEEHRRVVFDFEEKLRKANHFKVKYDECLKAKEEFKVELMTVTEQLNQTKLKLETQMKKTSLSFGGTYLFISIIYLFIY